MVAITTTPNHLIYPATIPSLPDHLSVLSYNVLLPNSQDGWWNYKMYQPPYDNDDTFKNISSWEYRSELLKEKIKHMNPDVVCMQEVSPVSFPEDFQFMSELGYDGVEMFRRGRFRPATFWKSTKCTLVSESVHKDRTLLTCFQLSDLEEDHSAYGRNWHVLNCHLQAGPQGKRRVRQIEDGVKSSIRIAKKLKEPDPTNPLLIVCGDFNGGSECGALHYLEQGEVGPTFIEDGEPVSSKVKKSPLAHPMIDVAKTAIRGTTEESNNNNRDDNSLSSAAVEPPSTLVVAELISQMVKEGSEAYQSPEFSDDMIERLQRCYVKYAATSKSNSDDDEKVMNKNDVEKWLMDINQELGRGDEFRNAAKEMGWEAPSPPPGAEENGNATAAAGEVKEKPRIFIPDDGILSPEGFLNVYQKELRGGKFWGINHDLGIMGERLPNIGVFKARFDRMYCSTSLVPTSVLDCLSDVPCPNETEPSDHLPVAASFAIAELN